MLWHVERYKEEGKKAKEKKGKEGWIYIGKGKLKRREKRGEERGRESRREGKGIHGYKGKAEIKDGWIDFSKGLVEKKREKNRNLKERRIDKKKTIDIY